MDSFKEAKNLIEKSDNIFIVPSQNIHGDSLGSSLALFQALKKLQKNIRIIAEEVPERFNFLLEAEKNFVISVDLSEKELGELKYEKNDQDIKIHLALKQGELSEKDLSFNNNQPEVFFLNDLPEKKEACLLITLGARNLEDLGSFFDKNPQFFYGAPLLNIDNHPSNENFGQVNLVKITSLSLAEITAELLTYLDETLYTQRVATPLLTALICASQNFQNPRTSPQTLETASFLIQKGAEHQKIIQHLYKTKKVSQIRLLGRILEKLNFDEKKELHWTTLTASDFQETNSCSKDLALAIEELKLSFWRLPSLLLLWESHSSPSSIKGVFYSSRSEQVEKLLENFEGISQKEGTLFLTREKNLEKAKEKVLNLL